ncbi:MAG TPA: CHASE3 domain-containing protein [Tepidisphaeraceae bacterium]|nr:CHASE3 domain-containing protein [Tepidisphaeraceae bacterium]
MKFSFAVVAAVLVASTLVMYWMGAVTLQKNQAVSQQQQCIDQLNNFLSTMKDAETGQRGFLLTGDESYLRPYLDATGQISSNIAALNTCASRGEIRQSDVAELHRFADEKLAELTRVIDIKRSGRGDAVAIVRLGHGKSVMDAIRDRVAGLVIDEKNDLAAASRTARRYTIFRTTVFATTALINLAFLYWAYRRILAERDRRETAALDLQRQKDLLAVTLASIGDAVIVTDVNARITFLNEVAEKLTGWTLPEAMGQTCDHIFHIINEDSRQPVESPVNKVLRLGVIVGLANHTLLIRKDKSEVPIDDSGAPIREPDGSVRGVVLVFRDFSDYKTSTAALLAAKDEAERASRAKDQFLAMLSHELRTPLTPVLATLTAWEASEDLAPAFISDVQMVRRNVELEARLIDDLLDLTRIAKSKLSLTLEVSDVNELIQSVAGMYQSDIHAKGIQLTMDLGAERHHVDGDPGRLQQVFWNILKNATKFTPIGGSIKIKTTNERESVVMTFTDSGIGIDSELLGRIFQPFEQGAGDFFRKSGGLGLGMAISKSLVDCHGGRITATSDGRGKGATFTITLPTVPPPAARKAETVAASKDDSRRLRILLVEDHADTANAMRRLLAGLGHSVEVGQNKASAIEKMNTTPFDLLLSDIGLPDGTGIELIREIRQRHRIAAIALTGFGMDEDIAKCKEAGFDAHITKPVNFQKLDIIIRQIADARAN